MEGPSNLDLERGGQSPEWQILGIRLTVFRRIGLLILLTWVPLLVLTLAGGRAQGPPETSFLYDFATHARYLIAIPLLVFIGTVVERRIGVSARYFIDSEIIRRPEDIDSANRLIRRMSRLYHSKVVLGILYGLALLGAWAVTQHDILSNAPVPPWALGDATAITAAGYWLQFVALPIFQFFIFRLIWRLAVWSWLLLRFSRMRLTLVPTHPDRVGGLGFLMHSQRGWALVNLALGSVLSSFAAFQMLYNGAALKSFQYPFITYLVLAEALVLVPLMPFALTLAKAKRHGLLRYGDFAELYVEQFEKKWLVPKDQLPGSPLGSNDISSLADLGGSFQVIAEMRNLPFDRKFIVSVAVLAALPMAPLLLLAYPVADVVKLVAQVLLKN